MGSQNTLNPLCGCGSGPGCGCGCGAGSGAAPYNGTHTLLIDRLIGNAYEVIKYVACHMQDIINASLLQQAGGAGGLRQMTGAITIGTVGSDGSAVGTITATGVEAGTYTISGMQLVINAAGQIVSIGSAPPPPTPFSITGFHGPSGVIELGQLLTDPAFTATYSVAPSGAVTITNTDGISSPLTLVSPYTSGTVSGNFSHSVAGQTTTFTLNAGGETATLMTTWQPAIFGGVGAAGATSSVTATGTTAVLSTTDVLARIQLGPESVGQTFGPFSPNGQNVYLLLLSGSHAFIDASTGFPFSFNPAIPVTFVNANGASVAMYLYASTNPLTGNFTPKVTS